MEIIIIGSIFLSAVVGFLGRKTYIGFWGNFIFSLFLSPVLPLVYVLLARASSEKKNLQVK